MADIVDQCSNGHTMQCRQCPETFSDINPEVAVALLSNHIRRHHGN